MTEVARRTYEIGGKKFYQTELVWGQVRWIQELMGSSIEVNLAQILDIFGVKLARFAAIVLVDEGTTQSDKVLVQGTAGVDALEQFLLGELKPSLASTLVADFFDLTNLASLLNVILEKSGAVPVKTELPMVTGSQAA